LEKIGVLEQDIVKCHWFLVVIDSRFNGDWGRNCVYTIPSLEYNVRYIAECVPLPPRWLICVMTIDVPITRAAADSSSYK